MRKKEKTKKIKLGPTVIFIIGLLIGYHTVNFSIDYKITNSKLVEIIFKNTLPKTEKELIYKVIKDQIETYYKDSVKLLNINLRNEIPTPQKTELPVIKEEINKLGFKVKFGKTCYLKDGYLAGTDEERISDIHEMFADPEIKAIICYKGGAGASRIIDKLDYLKDLGIT